MSDIRCPISDVRDPRSEVRGPRSDEIELKTSSGNSMRLREAGAERPDPPGFYDDFLLSLVPKPCERALEIGCGTGRFTRGLARRVSHVTAVDLSREMIRLARARVPAGNVDFVQGDALELMPTLGSFGCVVSLATFHHLPQDAAAECFKAAVAPGGTLILHDLWRGDTATDCLLDGVRLPVKLVQTAPSRRAAATHARGAPRLARARTGRRALEDARG